MSPDQAAETQAKMADALAKMVQLQEKMAEIHEKVAELQVDNSWWPSWLPMALDFCAIISSVALAVFVYKQTQRSVKLQLLRANFDAWKDIDMFFLSKDNHELLPLVGEITTGTKKDDNAKSQKKRLTTFLLLNPFYSYYYLVKYKLVDEEMTERFDDRLLELIRSNDVFEQVKKEAFVEDFIEYCQKLRSRQGRST